MSSSPGVFPFDVPRASLDFLSAATAAGNMSSTTMVKARHCPTCGDESLFFCAQQAAVVMSGGAPRRQFKVIACCRTPDCKFIGPTNGKFTLA